MIQRLRAKPPQKTSPMLLSADQLYLFISF